MEAAEVWTPPEMLSTVDFLEKYYYLPDAQRYYSFYYAPYFLGVANALDDPEVKEINLRKAAQIGWTIFIIGYLSKKIFYAPYIRCPIMGLFAKTQDGKNFHDEKLVEIIRSNDWLDDILGGSISRKAGVRWDSKSFVGGFLKLVGSNSPGNVKSTSKVGVGFVEEPDDTQANVAGQGDSITNLQERLKRYVGSQLIVGGTPATKGLSKIDARLEKTDRRQLPIKCHSCGESHVLNWANVIWETEAFEESHPVYGHSDPTTAVYVCPECGTEWDDRQRKTNVRNTCFEAHLAGDKAAGWKATKPFFGEAGFDDLSELYVCMPGTSLADVVSDYLEAQAESERGDQNKMIAFINQKLGQSYEYQDDNATADELRDKAEDYPELIVPRKALFLVMGIDIQHDRIAVTIYGVGAGFEMWLVYFGEIWAARYINDLNDPVWNALDDLLFGSYEHETGVYLNVLAASLDTSDGITQGATYHYVRTRRGKGVNLMAIKGAKEVDAPPVSPPRKMDLNATRSKADRFGLQLWRPGTQLIKDQLSSCLRLPGNGPNRIHIYADVRTDFFDQMTGEVKAPHRSIKNRLVWQPKPGQPIEAWDCTVYAIHAGMVQKLHMKKPEWWQQKEAELLQGDLLGGTEAPPNVVRSVVNRPEITIDHDDQPEDKPKQSPQPAVSKPAGITVTKPSPSPETSMADLARMMGNH